MTQIYSSKNELLTYLKDHQHKRGKDVAMSTLVTYHYDIWDFLEYCKEYEADQPTPYTLAEGYVKQIAVEYSYFTLTKKIQAVRFYLHLTEQSDLFAGQHIQALLSNIKRYKDLHQKQAPTFTIEQLKHAVDRFDAHTKRGIRNKALFLVGFMTAMRKSELLSLLVKDVQHHEKGLVLSLGVSKNNQYGEPAFKALFHGKNKEYCPVHWLLQLIAILPDHPNQPLFTALEKENFSTEALSNKGLDYVIKQAFGPAYSSHSFRASFVSIARQHHQPDSAIMRQTHHSNAKTLDRYTRYDGIMTHNAAEHLGL